MKILIISQWYPPEPTAIFAELAESLQKLGHEVTVVTGFPNYPAGKVYNGYKIVPYIRETINKVRVIRLPLIAYHGMSRTGRMANYVSFALTSLIGSPLVAEKPDIIYAAHTPATIGVTAYLLSRFWKVPYICSVLDMWPETLESTGFIKSKRILGVIEKLENLVYGNSSAIRVITPGFKAGLIEKGVSLDKIEIIPDWVDTDFYKPLKPDQETEQNFGISGKFNILYAGTIGPAQGLEVIIETAEALKELKDIQFVLAGEGIEKEKLESLAKVKDLNNIQFIGGYGTNEMPKIYAMADVLFVALKKDPLFKSTIPHKLYEYFAAGKPVLGSVEGDCAKIIEAAQAGWICRAGDAADIAEKVIKLRSLTREELELKGKGGREYAIKFHNKDLIISKISGMLETAAENK